MTTQLTNDNEISYIILTQIPLKYDKDSNKTRCLGMTSETDDPPRAMAQDACKSGEQGHLVEASTNFFPTLNF